MERRSFVLGRGGGTQQPAQATQELTLQLAKEVQGLGLAQVQALGQPSLCFAQQGVTCVGQPARGGGT